MEFAYLLVRLFYAYLLAGVVFAVLFWRRGAAQLDEDARGISWRTRALLFPGTVALWPLLWRRWNRHRAGRTSLH
jgi:hypothetical protein